jgi:PelA/Pel-15E family pectate lyase
MLLRNSFLSILTYLALTGLNVFSARAADAPRPWPPDQFLPLTEARIAALPEAEQGSWRKYLENSRQLAKALPAPTVPDFSPDKPLTAPLAGAKHAKGLKSDGDHKWFASEEARGQADRVGEWQSPAGGWTKSNDYSISPSPKKDKSDVWSAGTFDNDATILEMRFLMRVIAAADGDKRINVWQATFLRGLQYIFNAQYPNGGFPQIYPLGGGYHDAITYNDNAMGRVLELLRDIAAGRAEYAFVSAEQRTEASRRFALGIDCILKSQIVDSSGRRTVWGQQHDMLTLKPCAARNFEPIAASASESTSLVKLLMGLPAPSKEVNDAVNGAVEWFGKVALRDAAWRKHHLEALTGAEPLWARMYEIGTDKPVFGDRDRTIHYDVSEISAERQNGYAWFGTWPETTLQEYKKWYTKQAAPAKH